MLLAEYEILCIRIKKVIESWLDGHIIVLGQWWEVWNQRIRLEVVYMEVVALINGGVITIADLEDFSDRLKESVDFLLHR